MAAMTDEQKKKVTGQMASRFFAPVSRPAPGAARERATSARTATADPGRTRDPVLDQIAASLLASPVVSRDRNLTDSQNAQLTRDSIIRTTRQNQDLAGKLLERDLANRGEYDKQRLANVGGLEQQGLSNQGALETQGLRNKGIMDATALNEQGATGRLQMQEKGLADRLLKGHGQELEKLGVQNRYNREATNRDLVKTLLAGGAQGDARMTNLYNQGGAFNADLEGLAVPREPEKYGFTKLAGGYDEQSRPLPDQLIRTNPRTGQAEYAPLVDTMLGGQGGPGGTTPQEAVQPATPGQRQATSYQGRAEAPMQALSDQEAQAQAEVVLRDVDPNNLSPEQATFLLNLGQQNPAVYEIYKRQYAGKTRNTEQPTDRQVRQRIQPERQKEAARPQGRTWMDFFSDMRANAKENKDPFAPRPQ